MAKITFEKGDFFSFRNGVGVVIAENTAVLVKGEGGRTGYKIERGNIPADAMPVDKRDLSIAVRLALETALIATA